VARALVARGRVQVAAGVIQHWPGRAEAWMLCGAAASRAELVLACRHIRAVLDYLQRDPEWRRVEMCVLAEAPWRPSFARALGFRCEGVLAAWDPLGRDHVMYARVMRL
jgi:hypothetical protein